MKSLVFFSAILVLCLSAGQFLPRGARAEQLPVKTYTTADGLLRDQVNRIKRDSRGFLWFCTNDGLSRFDGYGFTNYTTDDGLPHRKVNDLLETRGGAIRVAKGNGLARFNPKGRRNPADSIGATAAAMFGAYRPDENAAGDHPSSDFARPSSDERRRAKAVRGHQAAPGRAVVAGYGRLCPGED